MEQALQEEAFCFPISSPTPQLSLLVLCLRRLDSSPDKAQHPLLRGHSCAHLCVHSSSSAQSLELVAACCLSGH